jgi:hypothetical protein
VGQNCGHISIDLDPPITLLDTDWRFYELDGSDDGDHEFIDDGGYDDYEDDIEVDKEERDLDEDVEFIYNRDSE